MEIISGISTAHDKILDECKRYFTKDKLSDIAKRKLLGLTINEHFSTEIKLLPTVTLIFNYNFEGHRWGILISSLNYTTNTTIKAFSVMRSFDDVCESLSDFCLDVCTDKNKISSVDGVDFYKYNDYILGIRDKQIVFFVCYSFRGFYDFKLIKEGRGFYDFKLVKEDDKIIITFLKTEELHYRLSISSDYKCLDFSIIGDGIE